MSLFDVENLEEMPKVRDMTVGPVSTSDVQEFARRYHYTETGGNMTWRWGLWHGPVLHGVVAYNLPTRSACESVFGAEHGPDKVWHMGRLILSENSPRNSESRLIGGSLRAIESNYPDVWGVLTYAATDVGHIGYVYQATNAIYTGPSSTEYFYIDPAGARRSSYLGGSRVKADRAESMGWSRRDGMPKHRYLYVLGNKAERRHRMNLMRLPILPYPKKTGGDAIATKQTTSPPPDSTTQGGTANEQLYSPNAANQDETVLPISGMSTLRGDRVD
jgi:hypothetical protein